MADEDVTGRVMELRLVEQDGVEWLRVIVDTGGGLHARGNAPITDAALYVLGQNVTVPAWEPDL